MRSRTRIIESTLGLIEAEGFAAVHVSSVAAAAGVSRQTVYSIFGSREELVSQAVATVAMAAVEGLQEELRATGSALEYVVELLVAGRGAVRREPVLRTLVRAEVGNPVFDEGMMPRARAVVAGMLAELRAREPSLADDEAFDDLAELATRLSLSIVLFESEATATDDALRAFLRRWLAPALREPGSVRTEQGT